MRKIAILLMSVLMLSMFLVGSVAAPACDLNLPSTQVTMVTVYGTTSYFDTTLSNVGPGFDVTNGVYPGWCIDSGHTMMLNTNTDVMLYSSCDVPTTLAPPLHGYDWNRVNYILNNKPAAATVMDIQTAIWDYIDVSGSYPITAGGQAIVDDADSNGGGFVPSVGQIVAVICFPINPDPWNTQISIIEVEVPEILGGGKVTGGGQIKIGEGRKDVGSFGFNAMWFSRDEFPKGEIEFVNHVTGDKVHAHPLTWLIVETPNPGNKPWPMLEATFTGTCSVNHVDGYTFTVYVRDNAEPKNPDYFSIEVRDAGSNIVPEVTYAGDLLHGNIQIHKPPK